MAKKFPYWATDNLADIGNGDPSITDPGAVKQALGWVVEKPLLQTMNWLLNLLGHFVSANNKVEEVGDAYQSEVGQRLEIDNSAAIRTILLPDAPEDGQWVEIASSHKTSDFMVTADGGTKDIMVAADTTCNLDINNTAFRFWWSAAQDVWKIRIVNAVGSV